MLVLRAAVGATGTPVNAGEARVANPATFGIVGLFNITPNPDVAFQSDCTWAAGIVGLFVRSV